MKDTKRIFIMFSFYDRTGIVKFLEKQAGEGWLLEKISAFGWKFRRIEPKSIHFSVNFFPEASAFDPGPSEKQETFREFCEHTGWRLAARSAQIQIFYNESSDPVPIDTDPNVELENIHRSVKKTLLPTYLMQLILAVWQIVMMIIRLIDDPIMFFSMDFNLFAGISWLFALLFYSIDLAVYYSWRARAKREAQTNGGFLETRGTRSFQIVAVLFMLIALAMMLLAFDSPWMTAVVFGTIAGILAITAVVLGISALLKRAKATAKTNRAVTLILTIVLSLAFTGVLMYGVVNAVLSDMDSEIPYDTYEFRGHTYNIYRHELPLTVEDLMLTDYDSYSYQTVEEQNSMFLQIYSARQRPKWNDLEEPELDYTVVNVKAGFLFDLCMESMLHRYDGWYSEDIYGNEYQDSYLKIDPAPWGADVAYQLCQSGTSEYSSNYLLCYGNRIVELNPDWDMTREQMGIVGELLGE